MTDPDAYELARRAAAAAGAQVSTSSGGGEHYPIDVVADAVAGLPEEEAADRVLAHAEGCDTCAALVAEVEAVSESLYRLQSEPMPDQVIDRLLAAVSEATKARTGAPEARDAQARQRLADRTATGTFGRNLPHSIDPRGLGLTEVL